MNSSRDSAGSLQRAADTAAHHMSADIPVAHERNTIREIHDMLLKQSHHYSTVNYIYILDDAKRLTGVLSVRELFSFPMDKVVGDVCKRTSLVTVHPETHQEHAAYVALKNNIKAVPVVDHSHVFLGEITSDTILSILHREMHEDALKKAGIGHAGGIHANVLKLSTLVSLRHRIPWLIVGLIGGLLVAKIVTLFETTLTKNLILASFIPLIVYMSDAVRTQMEAYIIRDLALDRSLPFFRYLLRHVVVLVLLALILSVLLFASFGVVYGDWHTATVLSVALCVSICSSVITGLLIPYSFEKMKLDPADASGPVATIVQDMLSVVIYFGIASVFL